ncbi:MAG: hypothetical protein LUF80_01570 [Oscillospiraceae bacterium]|nr:hypothetical protein [Oscillospiraceae bacterium]
MNKVTKGLLLAGAGAALAALLPYKVTRCPETGSRKIKALAWDLELDSDEDGRLVAQFHMPPTGCPQEEGEDPFDFTLQEDAPQAAPQEPQGDVQEEQQTTENSQEGE